MASHERSEFIENLTVNTIYTRGNNNENIPAFQFLTTDGQGGTFWSTPSSLSSLLYGASFHKIRTSVGTYTADQATNATFSLLDGPNAGLINDPTASNTAFLYAKAFGQFDISGQENSIIAFDPVTNKVNSNVLFVGTGGINITGDPQTNTMFFDGRELPFVSTLPYSFNKLLVYSNVPANTIEASTGKSMVMDAQGPSSLLTFIGEDAIMIKTNYAKNQITFTLSSISYALLSTIQGNQEFIIETVLKGTYLSTLSTTYKQVVSYDVSSLVYLSNLSSYNAEFVNLSVSSINNYRVEDLGGNHPCTLSTFASYISSYNAEFVNLSVSSINNYRVEDLGGNHPCTLSTFASYINNINSTINAGLSTMMCTIMTNPIAELGNDVSTISTLYTNVLFLTSTISSSIDTFSTSLVPYGGDATDSSTISTLLTNVLLITSTMSTSIDSFSTSLIPFMESTIITWQLYASTIVTSSINVSGERQPFIQYGSNTTADTVTLGKSYKDNTYAVQLTYSEGSVTTPLNVSGKNTSQFTINGESSKGVYWTTYGDIF